ncbi:Hypothetical predicted protein [Mytilus galloprovincialis]|uniref:Uncharacterized protein n=1 Tax=Mytilus galloprovincialis TaxID=29158 RepID=A0A8B6E576_MYTGA|nr:Hypothetical predicted protein [Mytilus galloprovincialis]
MQIRLRGLTGGCQLQASLVPTTHVPGLGTPVYGRYGSSVHLWYEDQVYYTDIRMRRVLSPVMERLKSICTVTEPTPELILTVPSIDTATFLLIDCLNNGVLA